MKILVTGSTGFVGSKLIEHLIQFDFHLYVLVRSPVKNLPSQVQQFVVGDFTSNLNCSDYLRGMDIVIHLAARVHIMNDKALDPLEEFRRVNSSFTSLLASQAVDAGVKRFIYLSSIKVNGEFSGSRAFLPDFSSLPKDPYGLSKYEAERCLLGLSRSSNMEVTIIRPPLVYGPGVKGNLVQLMSWMRIGLPLPLGAIRNKRSFVALSNLVDLIEVCIEHPDAANQVFLVSDNEDISTSDLLKILSTAMGKSSYLLPISQTFLEFSLKLVGREDISLRICGNLQVDISKTMSLLGWSPKVSMEKAIQETVDFWVDSQNKN